MLAIRIGSDCAIPALLKRDKLLPNAMAPVAVRKN
jgi:hypothetical protein